MIRGYAVKVDTGLILRRLCEGSRPREIAAECRVAYSTMRKFIARIVKDGGHRTTEQAVASYTAARIRAQMPLGVQSLVDLALRR